MATIKEWLQAASPEDREELAAFAHTSVAYLYQHAGQHRKNPKLGFAMRLFFGSSRINHRNPTLPIIYLLDMLTPEDKSELAPLDM